MSAEVIALVSSGVAVIVSLAALYLDLRIIRYQGEHHGLLRDLHHHHIVKPSLEAVAVDNGPSQVPGHEDCHGPVYRREADSEARIECRHLCSYAASWPEEACIRACVRRPQDEDELEIEAMKIDRDAQL